MEIFISGDLTTFASTLAERLLKDDHTVVVCNPDQLTHKITKKNFVSYNMHHLDALFDEIFNAHSFDAVIHIAPQKETLSEDFINNGNLTNGALEKVLLLSSKTAVEKFLLISSFEVFGDSTQALEEPSAQSDSIYGQILNNAEDLCQQYASTHDLMLSVIRLPFVYGPREKHSLLANLILKSKDENKVKMAVDQHTQCDFLHVLDLISFIRKVLQAENIYNIRYFNLVSQDINFDFLAQQLNLSFPAASYHFLKSENEEYSKKQIISNNAFETFGWSPQYSLINELPNMAMIGDDVIGQKRPVARNIEKLKNFLRPSLVWIEVILSAFLMHMLTIWTDTVIEFKYIDYRLLFVVIIGSIHGLLFGIIAAILAAISAIISWKAIGLDFALLTFNVESWIPFAMYFLAGAITGYTHDRKENEIVFEKNQNKLIHEKYEFLYSLYNEIGTIKNRLREQLVGYRDSFGRFFKIANKLNDLNEDIIFSKALEVLEDVMKNDQVAIYSVESTGNYGRLEVRSKTLTREIPKSLRLEDISDALDTLKNGNVFQNRGLIVNYPSYIAPILNEGKLIGLVIIWEADFNQYNTYTYNLFKVITGLIQSSLVRAATFHNAQTGTLYIPSTRIMKPESFKQALAVRKKMRISKISNFQVLRINRKEQPWNALDERLSSGIRADDIAGVLSENDNCCYVILVNADYENIPVIINRLLEKDIFAEYVEELESE